MLNQARIEYIQVWLESQKSQSLLKVHITLTCYNRVFRFSVNQFTQAVDVLPFKMRVIIIIILEVDFFTLKFQWLSRVNQWLRFNVCWYDEAWLSIGRCDNRKDKQPEGQAWQKLIKPIAFCLSFFYGCQKWTQIISFESNDTILEQCTKKVAFSSLIHSVQLWIYSLFLTKYTKHLKIRY